MKTVTIFNPAKAFSHVTQSTTFGELKKLLPGTGKERVPGITQLRENAVVVLHAKTGSGIVEVYDNGFYTYMENGYITVYAVDRCTVLEWRSCTGEVLTSEGANVSELPWMMPLEIAGTNRLEHNSDSRQDSRNDFSLNAPASANNLKFSVRPEHELMEEAQAEADRREKRILQVRSFLEHESPRRRRIIELYYCNSTNQEDVAAIVGVSQPYVHKVIKTFSERLEKNFSFF